MPVVLRMHRLQGAAQTEDRRLLRFLQLWHIKMSADSGRGSLLRGLISDSALPVRGLAEVTNLSAGAASEPEKPTKVRQMAVYETVSRLGEQKPGFYFCCSHAWVLGCTAGFQYVTAIEINIFVWKGRYNAICSPHFPQHFHQPAANCT